MLAGMYAAVAARGGVAEPVPRGTALGSLVRYITEADAKRFQPANITFDLLEPLDEGTRRRVRDKRERHGCSANGLCGRWRNGSGGYPPSPPGVWQVADSAGAFGTASWVLPSGGPSWTHVSENNELNCVHLKMKDFAPVTGQSQTTEDTESAEILAGRYSGAEARSFCAGFGTTEVVP